MKLYKDGTVEGTPEEIAQYVHMTSRAMNEPDFDIEMNPYQLECGTCGETFPDGTEHDCLKTPFEEFEEVSTPGGEGRISHFDKSKKIAFVHLYDDPLGSDPVEFELDKLKKI